MAFTLILNRTWSLDRHNIRIYLLLLLKYVSLLGYGIVKFDI